MYPKDVGNGSSASRAQSSASIATSAPLEEVLEVGTKESRYQHFALDVEYEAKSSFSALITPIKRVYVLTRRRSCRAWWKLGSSTPHFPACQLARAPTAL